MLKALVHYSPDEREKLLSDAIKSLLPDPGITPQESKLSSSLREEILTEVRERLSLSLEDNSRGTQKRILDRLIDELVQPILDRAHLAAVRARVEQMNLDLRAI